MTKKGKGNKDSLRVGVTLFGETLHRFLTIKQHLGIESNADVIRWLINWYYNRVESRSE